MILRRKLRFHFSLIVFSILTISLFSIYIASSLLRQAEFYDLLYRKAKTAATLLDLKEVDTNLLKKLKTTSISTLPTENILIYNKENKLIFHNNSRDWPINPDFIQKVRAEKYVQFQVQKYSALGIFHTGEHGDIVVIILAEDDYGYRILAKLKAILITVFIISIAVILIAGKIYVDRSLQPINNLIRKVNSMGINNLGERLDTGNRTDEIAKLAKAFNLMLDRLESAFESQKLFIANASHELRTPLTFISGQLEVLLIKARSVDEYKHGISVTHEDILKLIHTANRLLTLAHASSDFSGITFTGVRIDDIIWAAREEMKDIYPWANVFVHFSDKINDNKQIEITGNEMLLTSAFFNLMENGCKYSKNNTVDVFLETGEEKIVIAFKDNGIGIQKEEISHICEPFFRGTNVSNIKGKGIGLSIVCKVISLHKGSVTINSEPGQGSEFIITLPLTRSPKA